jgi:hypothetical protein
VPPLEVWEQVLVDAEGMAADPHGDIPCTECHKGQEVEGQDMAAKHAAHEGMIADPSVDAVAACGECHEGIALSQASSLHNNMGGYDTALYERSVPENHATIEEGESYHCNSCHTTCGQCHVSQPTSVGGGFIDGHVYNQTPSMSRQCTACHGSRVKNEYTGAHEGLQADVHLRSARMLCTDCHTAGEMHGTDYVDDPVDHRYGGGESPACVDCHDVELGADSENRYHRAHEAGTMSCQTCHSVAYANCYTCHLERTEDEYDLPYFRLEQEEIGFFIGLNPDQSDERPYRYVPVRHVPTWPGLFDLYGENVLDQFDNRPTWTYATPHNIQLNTPQTEGCESCHGDEALFLTDDKVLPEELSANAEIIVPFAPDMPGGETSGDED